MTSKTAAAEVDMPPRPWAFHYAGPINERTDYGCVTCLAKAQAKCSTHGTGFAQGCAHCLAAQGGDCHAHWGVQKAADHYLTAICEPGSIDDFKRGLEIVRAELDSIDEEVSQIVIDLKGSGDGSLTSATERAFSVQISVR